jgi:predicted RNase H-like HicB family nuclease
VLGHSITSDRRHDGDQQYRPYADSGNHLQVIRRSRRAKPPNALAMTCAMWGARAARRRLAIALLDSRPGWYIAPVTFTIEIEREDDGRWLAEVPALAGVMAYGQDRDEAVARVQALALRVIAARLSIVKPGRILERHGFRPLEQLASLEKSGRVLAAFSGSAGVSIRQSGSHRTLERPSWPDFVFAFHDNEEIGPRMLARIAKRHRLTSGSLART